MAHVTNGRIRIIIPHSIALITGYGIWLLMYAYLPLTQDYSAELSFFNLQENITINAPETVNLALKAPRATLDMMTPIIHIDAHEIPLNVAYLHHINEKNLLVPYLVEMVYCYPSVVSIKKTNHSCIPALAETEKIELEAL